MKYVGLALCVLAAVAYFMMGKPHQKLYWPAGERLIYRLNMDLNGKSLLAGNAFEAKAHVQGELSCDVLKSDSTGTQLRLELASEDFNLPVMVYLGRDGVLERAQIPTALSPKSATFMRALVKTLTGDMPPGTRIVLDEKRGFLKELLSQHQSTEKVGALKLAQNEKRVHLVFLATKKADMRVRAPMPYEPLDLPVASDADFARSTLGKLTLDDLLHSRDSDKALLERRFHALVRLHPEASMRLGEILKTAQRGTFEFHALLGALAQVGHAQAQAALREAVSSRMNEWNEASSILIAMAQMHRPDQETLRFFEKIVDDKHQPRLGSIAGLALGAAAKNLNQESIVRRFESELQSTQDTSDIRHLLLVLGNAGSQQALPTVLTYTEHPDPLVRANAALAMRFNTGTQAHDAILSLATRDSNEAVRREALHALAYQPTALGDLQTIAHLARSDTDFSVAQAAMELLAQHRAYQTLEDIAEHAATQKRRDAAMTLWRGSLQSSPSNPVAST